MSAHPRQCLDPFRKNLSFAAPLLCLLLLFFNVLLPFAGNAQTTANDWALTNAIRNARMQLRSRRPPLKAAELNRLAAEIGRSNYLVQAIGQAFMRNDATNAARLLGQFTNDINGLRVFGNTPLLVQAVRQRNAELLNLLLDRKANPDQTGTDGYTALGVAVQNRDWATTLRLISAGANVSTANTKINAPWSSTPLGQMVNYWWGGQPDTELQWQVLQQLLNHGADPFAPSGGGQAGSILESALSRNDEKLVDLLLTNRPSPSRRTPGGDTALHLAAFWGRTNAIEFLLSAGFAVNQTNNDGLTALQCMAGSAPHVKGNLAHGLFLNSSGWVTGPRFRPQGTYPPIVDYLLNRGATLDIWSTAGLGKTNELSALLTAHPDLVNARDGFGRTPLHYATLAAETNAAKLLIQSRADVSALTTRQFPQFEEAPVPAGSSPLHFAAMYGETEIINLLLQGGAAVDQTDAAGNAPLQFAAQEGWAAAVPQLIAAHASLDATNHEGRTALRAAVESGAAGSVEILLKAGAHLKVGADAESLLGVAAERGYTNAISLLMRAGLKLEERDSKGRTPFMRAVVAKQWYAMNLLLARGADINAADTNGDTALHQLSVESEDLAGHQVELSWLTRKETDWLMHPGFRHNTITNLVKWKIISQPSGVIWTNTSVTAWLLEHRAKPNLANRQGQTPLHLLLSKEWMTYQQSGATNRVAVLLDAGARLDIADAHGRTVLHAAISHAPVGIISMLLKRVDKLDQIRDDTGQTLLHVAATNHQFESAKIVSLLLENHADPNARDRVGRTPLHLFIHAAQKGDYQVHAEVVNLLLKAGADAKLLDNKGQTFLHEWCKQGRSHWSNLDQAIRELFALHPELVNATNAVGDTLLHVAVRSENYEAARMLMEKGADPLIRNAQGESALYLAQKDSGGRLANVVHPKGTSYNFYFAMATRNEAEFELFLKAEPRLANITFDNGQTALVAATKSGRKPRVFADRLLEAGAILDPVTALRLGRVEDARKLINQSTNLSSDIWFDAIDLKHFEELEDLAAKLGDLQALDELGHSLFYHAATSGQTNVAHWLQNRGVRPTFFDAVGLGDTNYLSAVLATNQSLANATYAHDQTVLMLAARARQRDSVRILIEHGAKIDAETAQGWNALHVASSCGAIEVTEELLRAGAQIDSRQSNGLSPLHLAASGGFKDIVRLLLDHGADVNQRQTDSSDETETLPTGSTALHWAALCGRLEVAKLLLKSGADVNATNAASETPLDLVGANSIVYWHISRPPGTSVPTVRAKDSETWKQIEGELKQAGGVRKQVKEASTGSEQVHTNGTAKGN